MKKEFVDYDVVREDYSMYELENGQIFKIKQVLTEIFNIPNEKNEMQAKINAKTISFLVTPEPIDTSDCELAEPKDVQESDETKELKFKIIKEPTSVYETKKSIIILINHVYKTFATTKKDKDNNPIIRFRAVHELGILEKPKFDDEQLSKNPSPNTVS